MSIAESKDGDKEDGDKKDGHNKDEEKHLKPYLHAIKILAEKDLRVPVFSFNNVCSQLLIIVLRSLISFATLHQVEKKMSGRIETGQVWPGAELCLMPGNVGPLVLIFV